MDITPQTQGLQHLPRPLPRPVGAGAGDAPPRAPGEQRAVPAGGGDGEGDSGV